MSVEQANTALAAAKKAYKANKADAGLKAAYKAAKAAVAAAEAKAAKKAAKKSKKESKKRKAPPTEEAPAAEKKQKSESVDIDALKAAMKEAKAAHKANKADASLKAAYKAAKKAVADAEAAPAAAEEATTEAAEESTDLLAGLKKNKDTPAATGNSGPKPSADHEGNPACEKVFCGNLSFDIDDDSAKEYFADCGEIAEIYWLTDKESGRFKGCGFITFVSLEASAKAVEKNGMDCMGREIRVNYAKNNKKKSAGGGGRGQTRPLSEKPEGCTTVFAGNLSWDIDDEKMKEFASDCGDVKSIRWLNDRDTGDFKGCGFVEFYDGAGVDEFVKKNGTELMGRTIRLDYAPPRKPRD